MPRSQSSSSSSNKNSSRSTATAVPPPKQQTTPSIAGGLMSSLMRGMAIGAGSEFIRGLFRSSTFGPMMIPFILSGLTTWGTRRFLLTNKSYLPFKTPISLGVFTCTFFLSYKYLNSGSDDGENYRH